MFILKKDQLDIFHFYQSNGVIDYYLFTIRNEMILGKLLNIEEEYVDLGNNKCDYNYLPEELRNLEVGKTLEVDIDIKLSGIVKTLDINGHLHIKEGREIENNMEFDEYDKLFYITRADIETIHIYEENGEEIGEYAWTMSPEILEETDVYDKIHQLNYNDQLMVFITFRLVK